MATKNIGLLKKSVFSLLNDNTTLRTLLGGTGRIHHRNPPVKPSYPHVIYEIIIDTDNPFNEDNANGEITETLLTLNIFSSETSSTESDNIEAQTKVLLHKKTTDLTNVDIMCYSCLRVRMSAPQFNSRLKIWIASARYSIKWAVK